MHPFHRLNRCAQSQKSCQNHRKDGADIKESEDVCQKSRKASPCRRRHNEDKTHGQNYYNQESISFRNMTQSESESGQTKKLNDILKAKEMALWSNTSPNWTSNYERLGPNKNRIIKESLKSDKLKFI